MKMLLTAALILCVAPNSRAADPTNPFRNSRVGDWVEYSMTTKTGGFNIDGKITMMVTARTETEVTLKTTATVNGMDVPGQETRIDITKPYDHMPKAGLPKDVKGPVQIVAEGKERIQIGSKEYDTTWQKMKIDANANGLDLTSNAKIWMSMGIPLSGMVRMEMNTKIANMEVKSTMELIGYGPIQKAKKAKPSPPQPAQGCQNSLIVVPCCPLFVPIRCRLGALRWGCGQ